jgi:RNA polymerase sigma-70 factor (ECF subfamily)
VPDPFEELADWMRAANRGDAFAYRRLLDALALRLRPVVRRGLVRAGRSGLDGEDIVQETLLAVHLKRQTWDETQPLMPWVHAIAHYKLVDALRRRGFREHLPIETVESTLPEWAEPEAEPAAAASDIKKLLGRLSERQREIVVGMAIEGRSAKELGERLGMADGTVRVVLHRSLRLLADIVRKGKS